MPTLPLSHLHVVMICLSPLMSESHILAFFCLLELLLSMHWGLELGTAETQLRTDLAALGIWLHMAEAQLCSWTFLWICCLMLLRLGHF